MALRKDNTAPADTAAGAFETPETETTVAANDEPAVKPATTTAVAARPTSAVITKLPTDTTWALLQNQIPVEELESLAIGTFPRITVGTDGFSQDKTKSLGKKLRIEVVSWNYLWLVTTGEQNNAEANKAIRTSYDGVNLKPGEPGVAEYVKDLKARGYLKAEVKKYGELYGNLVAYQVEENDMRKMVDVDVADQKFVQVSLSPQSLGQFQGFMVSAKMRKMKGLDDPQTITLIGEKKTLGANTFGLCTFALK